MLKRLVTQLQANIRLEFKLLIIRVLLECLTLDNKLLLECIVDSFVM